MAIDRHKILNYLYSSRFKLSQTVGYLVSLSLVRSYLLALAALNLLNWFLAYYANKNVNQTLVVLHYNVNLGVNLIGEASAIYVIPALGLLFIVINLILLLNLYRLNKFISHFLLGFSALVNFFLIIGTIAIYLINFR